MRPEEIGLKSEASQWFTPRILAERIVEWAGVGEGDRVIEPAAGNGALVWPLTLTGASVAAYELDADLCVGLRTDFPLNEIYCADFLSVPVHAADCVVTNPPYEKGLDGAFIKRALEWAPRVIVLMRTHALHGRKRFDSVWSTSRITRLALFVNRPSFGGGTPTHEFCVADIRRKNTHTNGGTQIEWWTV